MASASASGLFSGKVTMEGDENAIVPDRSIKNPKTLEIFKETWSPLFDFDTLLRSGGQDWYQTSGLW